MKEIKNWNGRRVLAIPLSAKLNSDPVTKAYLDAAKSLAGDLGMHDDFTYCRLCPMFQADAKGQCAHPLGVAEANLRVVTRGGCFVRVVVAEEYIPLVRTRLDPANPNR